MLSASPCALLAAREGSAALPDLGVDGWELPVRRKLLPVLPCLRDGCPGHMAAFEWLLLPWLVMLSPAEMSRPSLKPLCVRPVSVSQVQYVTIVILQCLVARSRSLL